VDVGRADRRAQHAHEQLARTGHGIGGLAHLEPATSQDDCTHGRDPFVSVSDVIGR
jgi:hypothetical protein